MAPLRVLVLALLVAAATTQDDYIERQEGPEVTVNVDDYIERQEGPEVTVNVDDYIERQEGPEVTVNVDDDLDTAEPEVIVNLDDDPIGLDPKYIVMEPSDDFFNTNPEEVDGRRLHEGDMLLTEDQWQALSERKFQKNGLLYMWPDGSNGNPVVPYRLMSSINAQTEAAIYAGIAHWEANTCIRFVKTTNTNQPHLRFIKGSGCYSYVGRIYYWKGQDISIGSGCEKLGIVAHEIGHAIGFNHEQSRTDRDSYVYINTENIRNGKMGNFEKRNTIDVIPYDYGSVMHYGTKGFTSNGLPTITTLDPEKNYLIGNREGLSFRDIHLANLIYKCIDLWMEECGITVSPCLNGGYIGQNCICECPPDTSGTNCETVSGDYYGNPTDNCTETVTTEGTLSSPDNPTSQYVYLQCTKVIQAPECFVPRLNFTKFSLYPHSSCEDGACCYYDSLDFKEDYPKTNISEIYCAEDIPVGFQYTATSSELIISYFARSNYPGWSAELTFVQVCTPDTTTTTPTTTTTTTTPTTTTTKTPPSTTTTTTTTPTTTTTTTPPTTTTTTTTPTTTTPSTTTTTTTTPPTTTTTSPPTTTTTTTTTTTPTTTTTTTPTTTTTTTTTPTTTTTTTTTTPPPPQCIVTAINGVFYWLSPNFGVTPYPTSFTCSISGFSTSSMLTIKSISFNLHKKGCKDYVLLTHLYDRTKKYCGKKKIKFQIPSFNFKMKFVSDEAVVRPGFNISLVPSHDPQIDCHSTMNLEANQTYTFNTPDFKTGLYKNKLFCEYRFIAPAGGLIKVTRLVSKVKDKPKCKRNFILMNGAKEKMYPAATSEILCKKGLFTDVMTTSTTDLYVAYQKTKKKAKGFEMTVEVI